MSDQGLDLPDVNDFPLDDEYADGHTPAVYEDQDAVNHRDLAPPANVAEEFDALQAANNPGAFSSPIPLDEQRRNISLEYASRVQHDNIDSLIDAAVKVMSFLEGDYSQN